VTAAAALAVSPVSYLEGRQQPGGGFAEPARSPSAQLTAWAALALRAVGRPNGAAGAYLDAHEGEITSTTDLELWLLGETAAGLAAPDLVARLRGMVRPGGPIGPSVNSTIWGMLALRQAGTAAPPASARWLGARQSPSGGWAWSAGTRPDSNDTAAALQALRAAGVRGAPIRRGLAFIRRLQNRDGGVALTAGRGSDTQSTAWAAQAFLAAAGRVPAAMLGYLARMRRADGSYRYSARYVTTPAWVTAQVLPVLARRPYPLR
jgi:hypothetical protein